MQEGIEKFPEDERNSQAASSRIKAPTGARVSRYIAPGSRFMGLLQSRSTLLQLSRPGGGQTRCRSGNVYPIE